MDSKGEAEDRLSSLPDSLLIHILSFLPTLDAIRTILIKRFGSLWTSLPSLDFEDSLFDIIHADADIDVDVDDEGLSYVNFPFFAYVRNVLACHRRPTIERFRVNISEMFYSDIEEKNLGHELETWINFALRKQVQVLEFSVGMVEPDEVLYKWPYSDFVNDSLVELKLEFLEMKIQRLVQLSPLRVLRLIRVSLTDKVFTEIIRGCPSLKELEIYNCWDLNELRIDAPNVEKLTLDTTEDYDFGHVLKINCPNLQLFEFTGFVDSVEVVNLSSLVDVTFNLRCRNMEFKEFPQFINFLRTLICAKVVKLSCEVVTVLFYCMLKDLQHMLVNWKHLKLSIWLNDRHIIGLNRLLRNLPHLESLVINITSWHRDFLEPIESELDNQPLEGKEGWSTPKTITIHNIANSSYVVMVHLIEILLKNALVLEELVIYYKGKDESMGCEFTSEQLDAFSKKLFTLPKASEHAKVLLG